MGSRRAEEWTWDLFPSRGFGSARHAATGLGWTLLSCPCRPRRRFPLAPPRHCLLAGCCSQATVVHWLRLSFGGRHPASVGSVGCPGTVAP